MTVIDLCAGPGGMALGARILGLEPTTGIELDTDACNTGRAAGFIRRQADIRTLNPADHHGVTGAIVTPPCPPFSKGGKRLGIRDMQVALDAITCLGSGCGCDWASLPHRVEDPRTALVVEAARWALTAPDLEWIVCEQVPAVEPLWEDICAELAAAGWETFNVINLDALDFGLPSRRTRTFLYARRYDTTRITAYSADLPKRTMAEVLGWEPGVQIWTRGDRKTSGGNVFSADGPSWCLTGSTRSWKIGAPDGPELTAAEAGLLNGFPLNYPWQGSRTKQFLQIADVVSPVVAAVVLGIATNTPWREPVRAYLASLYETAARPTPPAPKLRPRYEQLDLFGVAA